MVIVPIDLRSFETAVAKDPSTTITSGHTPSNNSSFGHHFAGMTQELARFQLSGPALDSQLPSHFIKFGPRFLKFGSLPD